GIWQRIQQQAKTKRTSSAPWRHSAMAIAASLLFFLGFGLAYLLLPTASTTASQGLADLAPELAKEEASYIQLIQEKEQAIQIEHLDSAQYIDIFHDLALLEAIHKEYQEDIPRVGPNQQLVQALIKYYEQKIRILERLSREIEINKKDDERNKQEQRI
ncbi:MAG: hypothetical protein AAGD05_09175, partial [Bacteroidota bacterium]